MKSSNETKVDRACGNCAWWADLIGSDSANEMSLCRRRAPVIAPDEVFDDDTGGYQPSFPVTHKECFCGDHEPYPLVYKADPEDVQSCIEISDEEFDQGMAE